jgi:hypothetical protein
MDQMVNYGGDILATLELVVARLQPLVLASESSVDHHCGGASNHAGTAEIKRD